MGLFGWKFIYFNLNLTYFLEFVIYSIYLEIYNNIDEKNFT